jgi:hypothetical protein
MLYFSFVSSGRMVSGTDSGVTERRLHDPHYNLYMHRIYSDDFIGSMPPFDTKEGVKMGLAAYRAAIPDVHANVEDVIAQGDLVAIL